MSLLKKISIGFLCTLAISVLFAFLYQFLSTKIDDYNWPPPGKMIDVGGYKMHINCSGEGTPTVILEAGLGGSSIDWSLVQPNIAKFATVCSYDRAGMGWSEKSPNLRTSRQMVEELHSLLVKANIPAPYILVGHSFGGIIMRQYANQYPDEVFGIVLVDSSHELQNKKFPPRPELTFYEKINVHLVPFLAPLGYPRIAKDVSKTDLQHFPADIQDVYLAKISTTKSFLTSYYEAKNLDKSFSQLENENASLGNKPLIVITAGKSLIEKSEEPELEHFSPELREQFDKVWNYLQKDLVTKSQHGKQIIAEKSDHMIPWFQPEIIVEAVREEVRIEKAKSDEDGKI